MCNQGIVDTDETPNANDRHDEPIPGLVALAGNAANGSSAESVFKMNIGRTGRDVEGDHEGGDRLAHDWFHALKNHEGALRFQKHLPNVRRRTGNISAFRGRFQDGVNESGLRRSVSTALPRMEQGTQTANVVPRNVHATIHHEPCYLLPFAARQNAELGRVYFEVVRRHHRLEFDTSTDGLASL